MENVPRIIRHEVSDYREVEALDEGMRLTSISAHMPWVNDSEIGDFRKLRASLLWDLHRIKTWTFNPYPKNLPKEIMVYMINWHQNCSEGYSIDYIQLTIWSEDRGLSHWHICSEEDTPVLFLGDISFPD